jgi:arylsulfatase A-like enzyme
VCRPCQILFERTSPFTPKSGLRCFAYNTIVVYTSDNGAEVVSWPDVGTTPFRGEKNTDWEGRLSRPRTSALAGLIKPGTEINAIFAQEDWLPTFFAAAGDPSIKDGLLKGHQAGAMTYKVHLDGYDQRDLLAGKEFLYWTDDGNLAGLR